MSATFLAGTTGFATAFSLILAIGAQNAFVLRQGLMRAHVFAVCLVCAASDALLITAGILGFGSIVSLWPGFPKIMAWAGGAFLIGYAALRLRAAFTGGVAIELEAQARPLMPALMTCLALTWLNPHVYLDTLGLIGAVSTQYDWGPEKWAFGIGAVLSSFVFFFSLGYGARLLTPIMRSARAWRILDFGIGVLMLVLAAVLIASA